MSPTHTQAPPLSPPPPTLTAHLEWSSMALKVIWPPGESCSTFKTFQLEVQSDPRTPVERRQNCTSRSVCSVGATQAWYRSEQNNNLFTTWFWSISELVYWYYRRGNVSGTNQANLFKNKKTFKDLQDLFRNQGSIFRNMRFHHIPTNLESFQDTYKNLLRNLGASGATLEPVKEPRKLSEHTICSGPQKHNNILKNPVIGTLGTFTITLQEPRNFMDSKLFSNYNQLRNPGTFWEAKWLFFWNPFWNLFRNSEISSGTQNSFQILWKLFWEWERIQDTRNFFRNKNASFPVTAIFSKNTYY